MIQPRLVREPLAILIGKLRTAAAPGEADAQVLKDGQSGLGQGVAGIGEAGRNRDPVFLATLVDPTHLGGQVAHGLVRDAKVIAGVVADLEAVLVELGDFLPGHVVAPVGRKIEAFRNKEGRPKTVLLEEGPHHCEMRFAGVIEGQNHQFVGDRLKRIGIGKSQEKPSHQKSASHGNASRNQHLGSMTHSHGEEEG